MHTADASYSGTHREFYRATSTDADAVRSLEEVSVQNYTKQQRMRCAHCPQMAKAVDRFNETALGRHLVSWYVPVRSTRCSSVRSSRTPSHRIKTPGEEDWFYDRQPRLVCEDSIFIVTNEGNTQFDIPTYLRSKIRPDNTVYTLTDTDLA